MNYLAHVFLSGNDDRILAGNFMGDFVKGHDWEDLPEFIARGALLHRFIDSYTDEHPISSELRASLRVITGHYSGVALDMVYDFLLASAWEEHGEGDLEEFSLSVYDRLEAFRPIMPENCLMLFNAMRSTNWLFGYKTLDGLDRALNGLHRRIGRRTGLPLVRQHLSENIEEFRSGFNRFFPELRQACSEKLASFERISGST